MFAIVISKKEPFENGARAILEVCHEAALDAKLVFLEDIFLSQDFDNVSDITAFYFLTNDPNLEFYIEYFSRRGIFVVNKKFYNFDRSKFSIQDRLRIGGVLVPPSITSKNKLTLFLESERIGFPCYIKSQKQASVVIETGNKEALQRILHETTEFDIYLEKSVSNRSTILKKFYFVYGGIYTKDEHENFSIIIKSALESISNILQLDIFSADIFLENKGSYQCIDINPAPGLFNSKLSRRKFVEYMSSLL